MRIALVLLAACTQEHYYAIDDLPVTEWTAGLPVSGDGRLVVWLAGKDWSNTVGFVRFRCDDCMLGDDRAQMKIEQVEDPFDFGRLALGDVRADLDFAGGHVTMTTQWRSADFELDAHVLGTLAPRAEDIVLEGCITFRPTAALLAHDPKMHALASITGAPLDADGRFAIKLAGTLGKMRKLGEVCSVVR